jgi:hypothetical protein
MFYKPKDIENMRINDLISLVANIRLSISSSKEIQ